MRLHENEEDFRDLCSITAGYIGIPEDAVRRDYYIVSMLQKLRRVSLQTVVCSKVELHLVNAIQAQSNGFQKI